MILRRCRECKQEKELNEENFIKRPTENGWRGRCRICHNKNIRLKQDANNTESLRSKKYNANYKKKNPLNHLLKTCKSNSRKYNREFTISSEYLLYLWNKQNGKCYYTGREMRYEVGFNDSVSIDRINSKLGYIEENVALCQYKVNVMKNDSTIEELLKFCSDIINNQKLNNEQTNIEKKYEKKCE